MRIVPRAIVKGVTAASVCLVLVLASPSRADVITDWNQTAIAAMKAANIAGNPWSRNMAMVHVAMSDAVNSVQNKYAIYAPGGAPAMPAGMFGGGAGAMFMSLNATFPKVTVSPTLALPPSMRPPLMNVPLLDPKSLTFRPLSSATSSACRREIVGSNTGMSLVGARPTIRATPTLSS